MELIVITSEQAYVNEALLINELFDNGLMLLHLRKPSYTLAECTQLIEWIHKKYYDRIVIHQHHSLAIKYALKGVHLTESKRKMVNESEYLDGFQQNQINYFSTSCHQIEDIKALQFDYAAVFLSPVFDSISKVNYKGKELDVNHLNRKVIALGGITPEKCIEAKQLGYKGVAALGWIWNSDNEVQNFKELIKECSHD